MTGRFDETGSLQIATAKWVKPVVRQLRAGAAELGSGSTDDGDPGGALKDS